MHSELIMIAPNDISKRMDEIQNLIASDNIQGAVKKLMDFVRDFTQDHEYLHEVIVISANIKKLDTELRRRIINSEEHTKKRNELLYQMLELTNAVQNDIVVKESLTV